MRELQQDSPKVNVWCGIMCNRIIGPFFFCKASITADVYLDLLSEYVTPQLIGFQPTIIFQQDGAPPHWGLHVHEFLNENFSNQWIGRDGQFHGHHVHQTSLPGLFLTIQNIVYQTKVRNMTDLRQRISDAIANIDEAMLQ